ncbi:MAG: hypothetical protein H6Q17_1368 [Bacteroidetes bacterium]|nr:hypothetical protein [Bacteroidota bacterium]
MYLVYFQLEFNDSYLYCKSVSCDGFNVNLIVS